MREIYLDNAATTPCDEQVIDVMIPVMKDYYGNPSALHLKGLEAEKIIKQSKGKLARRLKVEEQTLVFTSGGTESNNLGILGYVYANARSGKHLITTAGEHSSVKNVFKALEAKGYEVTYLPLDKKGVISLEDLEASLRADTILVSVMWVNNEVGSINPIDEIKEIIQKSPSKAALHVDGVQGMGKMPIYPAKWGIDILTASAHKFYGPKGVGLLYLNPKIKWKTSIYGGGQQENRRSGTENVAGILGLSLALEMAYEKMEERKAHIQNLRNHLELGLRDLERVEILSSNEGIPHICHIGIKGIRGEVLLHALEAFGIYVSTGSACSSHKNTVSTTLESMEVNPEYLEHSLRISFGYQNTMEEIDTFISILKEQIQLLSQFIRK